jgi:tRNA (mo5U34)-methyltransferase
LPWHFDIELDYGIRTGDYNEPDAVDPDKRNVVTIQPEEMLSFFSKYYPQGLAGKDVLDVACNAGGYSFLAHQLGARSVTGFDVRQHWLTQAMFIKSLKYPNVKTVIFQCNSAQQFFDNGTKCYDIVIFKRYILSSLRSDSHTHAILRRGAGEYTCRQRQLRRNTRAMFCAHQREPDPCDVRDRGLAWLPGGPKVVGEILRYKGFRSVDVAY